MRHRMQPWYTDKAVVIGPNIRWTMDDTTDLLEHWEAPLLGYCVHLETVDTVVRGALNGLRPAKIILLTDLWKIPRFGVCLNEVLHQESLGAKVEKWYVHRGRGIWRVV